MTEYIDELRAMWDSALSEAVRNRANKNVAENGDGIRHSYGGRGAENANLKAERAAKAPNLGDSNTVWAKYSLREFSDGTKFVDVQTDQKTFDGLTVDEMPAKARELIKSKFAGKVIGVANRAYVNGASANEYAHPVKNITDKKIKEAKMRASAELDNLIEAGQNFRTRPDGAYGHKHIRAVGGFSYFDVIFKVGNEYFKGTISIENNAKGARFMSSFLLFSICATYCTLSNI